jgi:hypothetical protein
MAKHSDHFIGGFHVSENTRHCLEVSLVRGSIDFRYGIANWIM